MNGLFACKSVGIVQKWDEKKGLHQMTIIVLAEVREVFSPFSETVVRTHLVVKLNVGYVPSRQRHFNYQYTCCITFQHRTLSFPNTLTVQNCVIIRPGYF